MRDCASPSEHTTSTQVQPNKCSQLNLRSSFMTRLPDSTQRVRVLCPTRLDTTRSRSRHNAKIWRPNNRTTRPFYLLRLWVCQGWDYTFHFPYGKTMDSTIGSAPLLLRDAFFWGLVDNFKAPLPQPRPQPREVSRGGVCLVCRSAASFLRRACV